MEKEINRLTTLAHAGRLSIFRLLMRRYPDAVPAGEIAASLGLKASTASAHLAWINDAQGDPEMHAHLLEFDTVHGR